MRKKELKRKAKGASTSARKQVETNKMKNQCRRKQTKVMEQSFSFEPLSKRLQQKNKQEQK